VKWTQVAQEDLEGYARMAHSIDSLQARIGALELTYKSLQVGRGEHLGEVKGGVRTDEDRLLDNIVERERLALNLDGTRRLAGLIEKGLDTLDAQERAVLESFYIKKRKGHVDALCERLCCERPTVYRLKDRALINFTRAMYGIAEY